MKRIACIFVFFAFVACDNKQPEPGPVIPVDNSTSVQVTAPTMSEGYAPSWRKGDIVLVATTDAKWTIKASEDGNPAIFKGTLSKSLSGFKALYPASLYQTTTSATNMQITLPNTQKGVPGDVAPDQMPMLCLGESAISSGITMVPICGLLKFHISSSDIKSVKFSVDSSLKENYLGADILTVNCSTLNTSIKYANEIYHELTMTPYSGSTFVPGDYYFCVVTKSSARAYSTSTMTYTRSDGSQIVRNVKEVLSFTSGSVQVLSGDENTDAPASATVHGTVKSSLGTPLSGILVSDGVQIVKTAADGSYSFTTDLSVAQNVFVIMPSEYEFSANEYGGWSNHALLDISSKDQQIDFTLQPRTDSGDKYRILLLGDPQQMSSRAHSGKAWTYVCNAINAYRSSVTEPLYQISMGDMVTNEIEVQGMAEAYLATQKSSGVLTFSIPGNHDHIQKADTYYASVSGFSKWFGPYNYSFNLGKQHFIFLDSVAWDDNGGRSYYEGLNDQAINYLEKDLAYVDVNTVVHIFTHCPLTKKHNGTFPSPKYNHARMLKALAGRTVNMWYGHVHENSNYTYTEAELNSKAAGVKALHSHTVARCGGCWSCSGEIDRDGSPRGFVELDIDGTDVHWQYHSIDPNYDHTMNLHFPGQFAGEDLEKVDDSFLYCNVYLWDSLWTKPEVWVNGSKVGEMTRVVYENDSCMEPLYQHFYKIWKAEGLMVDRDEPPTNANCNHLFKYVPESGVKKVEVRVTDRWGDAHSKEFSW